jgi:beta-glucosidase/6-phospho-beta-glucosidase/beta-galactosidase
MWSKNPSAEYPASSASRIFASFFLGGFECSTHRLRNGRRLDLVASTQHDQFAEKDYLLLAQHGIRTVREGLRWHLIEAVPDRFDFASLQPILRAATATKTEVLWDLWHYGWPDYLDIFSEAFITHFAAYARAAAQLLSEKWPRPFVCPVNEISFFSWAGGEAGAFNPFAHGRGNAMKLQLVRATIAAIKAMREINPEIRFLHIDPMISVSSARTELAAEAQNYHLSQFEASDMILGRRSPELGGQPDFIDVFGVNYYIHNQWTHGGGMIVPSDPRYRHVRDLLQENFSRYGKPLFVAETGIEDETRPAWLRYMCNEVYAAIAAGVPVEGICLYPIANHPGWDDDRHCHNGLVDYPDATGQRAVFEPLARELRRQQDIVARLRSGEEAFVDRLTTDVSALDWAAHVMEKRTEEGRSE